MMFDTHAHYSDNRFREDIDDILSHIDRSEEIEYIIEASTCISDSMRSCEFAKSNRKFFAVVGVHPSDADEVEDGWEEKLIALTKEEKVVGIGEIGLDYHYEDADRSVQKDIFLRQLNIAKKLDLPVVIHDRDAHQDTIEMCIESGVRGVFHSYSGSIESAKLLMSNGDWYFSFNGIATFKNAPRVQEVVKAIPDEKFLVETDCPYLAPVPHRGTRNDSFLMRETIGKIAELRGTSFEYIEKLTSQNAKRLFGIN